MKSKLTCALFCLFLVGLVALRPSAAPQAGPDWNRVAQILGKKGELSADGVYKVTFPRTDLRVMMQGAPLPVGMGLASWAAFTLRSDGQALVMGDTVMLGSEVNHVIDALRSGKIDVVALHNHMLGEEPPIYFLHYQGHGNPEDLARAVRGALDWLGLKVETTTKK